MIRTLTHRGKLIDDCNVKGCRRIDNNAPAHGNGIQLSRNRFLLLSSMLLFRGVDDSGSVAYQLRKDSYDGPVIAEGLLADSINDWDPLGDGRRCVKQFGHAVAFGVPKGAVVNGSPAPHANVFVFNCRIVARTLVRDGAYDYLLWFNEPQDLREKTQAVMSLQFRLNDDDSDIEILSPLQTLRQKGCDAGPAVCEHGLSVMNQTYVQPVPYTADGTEWIGYNTFDLHKEAASLDEPGKGPGIAALRYRFNPATRRYEWVQTGPLIHDQLFEPSVARFRDRWVVLGRRADRSPPGWFSVEDPFRDAPRPVYPNDTQAIGTPMTMYACPDGVIRFLAGDRGASPTQSQRNPLYLWDIDPDQGFRSSNRRVVFDTYAAGIKVRKDHGPIVDMPKLLPHAGGSVQKLIHRVRTVGFLVPEMDYGGRPRAMSPDDFFATAIYHADVQYEQDFPGVWRFE